MTATNTKIDMITDDLRERILNQRIKLRAQGKLPSISELANEYNTTRHLIMLAMETLRAEGVVLSRPGSGLYPAPQNRLRIPGITKDLGTYFRSNDINFVETNIEGPAILPASPEISKVFGVPEGTLVVRRMRRQGSDTDHYRFSDTYYLFSLIGEQGLLNMQRDPSYDALEHIRQNHGRVIRRVTMSFHSRLSNAKEQAILNIARGTPVVEAKRTSYADDDNTTVIMHNHIILDANKVKFEDEEEAQHWSKYWQKRTA